MHGYFAKQLSPLNNTAAVPSFLRPHGDQVFQMVDCTFCLVLKYLKNVMKGSLHKHVCS